MVKTLLIEDEPALVTQFIRQFPTLCDNLHIVGSLRALDAALDDGGDIIVSDKDLKDGSTERYWGRYKSVAIDPKRIIVTSGSFEDKHLVQLNKFGYQIVQKPNPEGLNLAIKIALDTFK